MDEKALTLKLSMLHRGDRGAFEELYEELKTPVYTVAFRILWDRALAEDVMQEVFLRLFRRPPGPEVRNPRAFIFRMARNLAIDSRRKPMQAALAQDDAEAVRPSPEEANVLRLDVERALAALPVDAREMLALHINAGLKFREIADILGIPLGTALWRYQKAIGSLRELLSGGM